MKQTFFDLVDEYDAPTGLTASYDDVHSKGLWTRGVHAIIYTPDNEIVMQKRAITLKYHPDLIEISVGGGVDAGESPEQAMVREIKEELGLDISIDELRFISKTKYNHPARGMLFRTFIYSYAVCIPKERLRISINPEETSSAFLLSKRRLKTALRLHRIKNRGRISGEYAFWKYLLDAIG
jgi:8-oxo-dGTP pyrophosphatase MutT (NUDIX family)